MTCMWIIQSMNSNTAQMNFILQKEEIGKDICSDAQQNIIASAQAQMKTDCDEKKKKKKKENI